MKSLTTIAAMVGMALSPLACNPVANTWEAEVRRLAQPIVDGGLVPGMVVGIYDGGRTEVYGLGKLDDADSRTPDGSTEFEIGSISKVFTSLIMASAVERSEVTLDEPLSKLLPKDVEAPKRDGKEITLQDLATHFSGLPRIPDNMKAEDLVNPYKDYTRANLFEFVGKHRLRRAPGAQYEYSNLGVGLLGQLLVDATHKDYETLLHERVTEPLKMADTAVTLSADQQSRLAPGHRSGKKVENWTFSSLVGCGGVRSTANDMLKLVAAHAKRDSSPLWGATAMVSSVRHKVEGNIWSICLGWHMAGDGSTLWHTGQTGGYSSAVFVNPMINKGVVVLANGADSAVDVLGERIFQAVAGMKVEPPKVRPSVPLAGPQLDKVVGEYPSPMGLTMYVTRDGDAIYARLTGQSALRVFPESPTRFFYRDVEAEIEFAVDAKEDHATSLTLFQNGQKIKFDRKQ